ncbi:uncharacterized protein LOC144100581 isoform X2 [Amblyomma americanum]
MPVQRTCPPSVPSTTVGGRAKKPERGLGRHQIHDSVQEDAASSSSWRQPAAASCSMCHVAACFGLGSRVDDIGGRNSAARRRFPKQPSAKNISWFTCSGSEYRTEEKSPW